MPDPDIRLDLGQNTRGGVSKELSRHLSTSESRMPPAQPFPIFDPDGALPEFCFDSRRSPVLARNGMVAANQPLAVSAGLSLLQQGGSAADAAVAMAAVLAVVEPCSTGLGGDAFFLYHDAPHRLVHGYNGSGRAPAALCLDLLEERGLPTRAGGELPPDDALTVTVPGACATWCDLHQAFGALDLGTVLETAIRLAREGFAVGPVTAELWRQGAARLKGPGQATTLLVRDSPTSPPRPPDMGEPLRNPLLADVLETVARGGKEAFYLGWPGERIVAAVREHGGVLTMDDLADHLRRGPDWSAPCSTLYRGVRVFECSPNGQGLAALVALNVLDALGPAFRGPPGSRQRLHCMIEALRQGFAVARRYVADPETAAAAPPGVLPLDGLLAPDYARELAAGIDPERAMPPDMGLPLTGSDTVQFCVVDAAGNACSMVNSIYMTFGAGIVPEGCGFSLHNRGHNFSLEPGHANVLAPRKRPYHTIIPAMVLGQDGALLAALGVMGGFMQPQGHVQVLVNLLEHGMDPQAALDAPRFCLLGRGDGAVALEEGIPERIQAQLKAVGHETVMVHGYDRALFGRGQIILRNPESGMLMAGSDPRGDGCALGH